MLSVHILKLLLSDLKIWIERCDEGRKHGGEYRFRKTARRTFLVLMSLVKDKTSNNNLQTKTVAVQD